MNKTIVALSGGMASAWCADWAIKNMENVVLYFNDTKWEHPDLYRFLKELSNYWGIEITEDSDGRSPDDIFLESGYLGNSRVATCSIELKAKRLQKYFNEGDTIILGIGPGEEHRADRIKSRYNRVSQVRFKTDVKTVFPIIEQNISDLEINKWLDSIGIARPIMYDLGFSHNNCSGGCVRAGKKQWKYLLEVSPDVYKQREDMENRFRDKYKKDVTILKDITLTKFRENIEANLQFDFGEEDDIPVECIGCCLLTN